jgi:hypothetical protein
MPQATGNAVISCIHAAHTKYELNPLDWQRVIEIGWRLLTKQDMGRFEGICKEGLLGPGDYGLFEDWLAIDGLREAYFRIRDGLVVITQDNKPIAFFSWKLSEMQRREKSRR